MDSSGLDACVPLGIVDPGPASGGPASPHPPHCAVDVQDLEHGLQSCAAQTRDGLQHIRAQRSPALLGGVIESRQDLTDRGLGRESLSTEPVPDGAVLGSRQEHHLGAIDAPTGSSDLLVVGHR